MLTATALVLVMTPALGLFYAGLVRSKNTLNTFMMCLAALGAVTITWAVIAYSLAFDEGNGFIGGLGHAFLNDVTLDARPRPDDPRPALHGLPGHVLHPHRRPDLRRGRRAHALHPVPRLHRAVGVPRLRADGALGLGRRLARRQRHARLGRRRAGRDGVGLLGLRGRARRRRAQGLRPPGRAAAQRHLRARSAPACSGSAGSASTAAAASTPPARRSRS